MAELANAPVRPDDLQWQLRVNADVLKDAFFTHVLPPSGLGSRHGSAAHKCHTWLHQHRLECFDWRSVGRMLLCYFSVAVDKGPEQKLGKIKTSAGAMFPWWIDIRFDDDGLIGLPPPDHDDVGDDADVRLDSIHIITVNGTYTWWSSSSRAFLQRLVISQRSSHCWNQRVMFLTMATCGAASPRFGLGTSSFGSCHFEADRLSSREAEHGACSSRLRRGSGNARS